MLETRTLPETEHTSPLEEAHIVSQEQILAPARGCLMAIAISVLLFWLPLLLYLLYHY